MALTCLAFLGFPTLFLSATAAPTHRSSSERLPGSHHPLVSSHCPPVGADTEPSLSGLFSLNGILNWGLGNAWACAPFFIGLKCDTVCLAVMICDNQTVAWLAALWGREGELLLSLFWGQNLFFFAICRMPHRSLPIWAGSGEQAECDGPFANPGTFQPCTTPWPTRTAKSVEITEEQIRLEDTCRWFGKAER